jgi:hypothetical protein
MPIQTEAFGKKKKMMRVALSVTGATAAGAGIMAPTAAKASTEYYQIVVYEKASVYRMQICGYNQNDTWICTGNSIPTETRSGAHYAYMKNWWWRGHIKLWWNGHGAGSWDQCSVPISNRWVGFTSSNGFFIPGRVAVLSGNEGGPVGAGASEC